MDTPATAPSSDSFTTHDVHGPTDVTQLAGSQSEEETEQKRRQRSKISRLPAAVRNQIDELLHDGLTYGEVIREIGDPVSHVTEMDVSRWMTQGGHEIWVKQQAWLTRMSASFAAAKDIVNNNEAVSIHEANLHLAATQMYESMIGGSPDDLSARVKEDPQTFIKLIQAIPRYAQQALNYQKFREACAQAHSEIQKLRDPNRELTDSERNAILDKLDRILGLK